MGCKRGQYGLSRGLSWVQAWVTQADLPLWEFSAHETTHVHHPWVVHVGHLRVTVGAHMGHACGSVYRCSGGTLMGFYVVHLWVISWCSFPSHGWSVGHVFCLPEILPKS